MPKTILLVEDSPDDAFLIRNACEKSEIAHALVHVADGEAAVTFLTQTDHHLPDLVFLDIKLPKLGGHEVLQWIREQPRLKNLPVIMLTHSDNTRDVERAYQLGVTSYLMKTADPKELLQGVRIILRYWVELNVTPE